MSLWHLAAGRAVVLGLISAVLMALAIILRDEIWNSRTITLIIIWLLGGILGTFSGAVALAIWRRLFGTRFLGMVRAVIFLPAFLAAGAAVFYLQTRWQNGFELHPDYPLRSLIFGSVQTMAMFVYTVSHYMLPWMAPVMIVVGLALMPRPEA